jgi:abortive infection bacteriophage resistance protein
MNLKRPLCIDEQIDLLKKKGMLITNAQVANRFLHDNNYYRLNYYFKLFLDENNLFIDGCSFDNIIRIYYFDRWFRFRLLEILQPIEIKVRSNLAYYLAIKYGAEIFYNEEYFSSDEEKRSKFLDIKNGFEREKESHIEKNVVDHHNSIYDGVYPIWVIVEFLSFSSISSLYGCLPYVDQKIFSLQEFKIGPKYLGSWLHSQSFLRNQCAHHKPLFERDFNIHPKIGNIFDWEASDNRNLFAMLLTIKRLSDPIIWNSFLVSFKRYVCANSMVPLYGYGIPDNWGDFLC